MQPLLGFLLDGGQDFDIVGELVASDPVGVLPRRFGVAVLTVAGRGGCLSCVAPCFHKGIDERTLFFRQRSHGGAEAGIVDFDGEGVGHLRGYTAARRKLQGVIFRRRRVRDRFMALIRARAIAGVRHPHPGLFTRMILQTDHAGVT